MEFSSDEEHYDMWRDLAENDNNIETRQLPVKISPSPATAELSLPPNERRLIFISNRITELENKNKTETEVRLLKQFINEKHTLEADK